MKQLIYIILFAGLAYYIYQNHLPFQTKVTDPYYLEIRIHFPNTDVKIVGFGKTNSLADCEARGLLIWKKTFEGMGEVSKKSSCKKEISKKYMKLFQNKQISATYIVFEKGNDRERDGRFVIYGVPSSQVQKECSKIISNAKKSYKGNIKCIQGKVG